jgi:hypothetical protein
MSPITSALRGKAVDPASVPNVAAAFADACRALGLPDQTGPLAEQIAEHIVAASQRGIRTKIGLYFDAVLTFKPPSRGSIS